jgi:hypothetical protein
MSDHFSPPELTSFQPSSTIAASFANGGRWAIAREGQISGEWQQPNLIQTERNPHNFIRSDEFEWVSNGGDGGI